MQKNIENTKENQKNHEKQIITIQKCETVPNKPNKPILRDFCSRAGLWSQKSLRIGLFGLFGTVSQFWMVIIGF